jgi:hypothetical protein
MPESITLLERQARVAQVIAMLGLHDCADTYVGDALTRGISGGQLKRYCTTSGGITTFHTMSVHTAYVCVNPIFCDMQTAKLSASI